MNHNQGPKIVMVLKKRNGEVIAADYYEHVHVSRDGRMVIRYNALSKRYRITCSTGKADLINTAETPHTSYAWYECWTIAESIETILDIGSLEDWPQPVLSWLTTRL